MEALDVDDGGIRVRHEDGTEEYVYAHWVVRIKAQPRLWASRLRDGC